MINLPNFLSFLRFPLAFLFLQENVLFRITGILLAMLTDFLDGFLARRYKQTSVAGRLLDPITDKFFVSFILIIFVKEGQIKLWEAFTFFSRDLSVLIFGLYLFCKNKVDTYSYAPFWTGKIMTTVQLTLLLGLTLKLHIPNFVYSFMLLLGFICLIELFSKEKN